MLKAKKNIAPNAVNLPTTRRHAAQADGMSSLEALEDDGVVLIGKSTKIKGEIIDSSVLDIRGEFEGNVASQSVIVREGASYKGSMHTKHVVVHGLLEGALVAEELLDIRPTGCVNAKVSYGELSVAAGACLTGSVELRGKANADGAAETSFEEAARLNGFDDRHISSN